MIVLRCSTDCLSDVDGGQREGQGQSTDAVHPSKIARERAKSGEIAPSFPDGQHNGEQIVGFQNGIDTLYMRE